MNIYIQDNIFDLLACYDIDIHIRDWNIIKIESLSPDSWAVKLMVHKGSYDDFYVLYGEDSIENVEYIQKQIAQWHGAEFEEFILPRVQVESDDPLERMSIGDGDHIFLTKVKANKNEFWGNVEYSESNNPTELIDPEQPFISEWKKKLKNKNGK